MALADSRIERDLGIDGVAEVVLYAAGVGVRPAEGYVQWPSRPAGRTYVSPALDGYQEGGTSGRRGSRGRRGGPA